MQRYMLALITLATLVATYGSSSVGAQQRNVDVSALPPSSCYVHPIGLDAGNYAWDAPACAGAKVEWENAHANHGKGVIAKSAVRAGVALDPSAELALSNRPARPAQEVDKTGLAFVTNGLAQPPANTQPVWLPKGTLFPVHTMQSYSTFEARPHGKLRFELDQDVVVNGFLVAMKGDTAEGSFPTVMTGRSFLFFEINGSLFQIAVDKIYNFCGDEIDVDFDRTEYRSARLGLFEANMDQHIIRGQEYVSFTSRPQRVCGVPTKADNTDVSPEALYPTTH